jgi:hypothetical protein
LSTLGSKKAWLQLSEFKETGGVSLSLRDDPEANVTTFDSLASRPFDEPFEWLDASRRRLRLSSTFRVAHQIEQCRRIRPPEFAKEDPIIAEVRELRSPILLRQIL